MTISNNKICTIHKHQIAKDLKDYSGLSVLSESKHISIKGKTTLLRSDVHYSALYGPVAKGREVPSMANQPNI